MHSQAEPGNEKHRLKRSAGVAPQRCCFRSFHNRFENSFNLDDFRIFVAWQRLIHFLRAFKDDFPLDHVTFAVNQLV
jgi:hypothetical protein